MHKQELTLRPLKQPRFGRLSKLLEQFAVWTTTWVGSSWAFVIAGAVTATWLITGPIFHFSDTWQLVMNTISSIVTFLMVFLIQRSQNKDTLAMQIKLNEIVAALAGASNRVINVESLSEEEVRDLHRRYDQLTRQAEQDGQYRAPLSIDQALAPASPAMENKAQ